MTTDQLKRKLRKKAKRHRPENTRPENLLSTGSTILNLACSGHSRGGFPKGSYILFVGDSRSGKTFFTLTCLAEASIDSRFDDYRLIYDGPEYGALMDWDHYFGPRMAERTEPPAKDKRDSPLMSETVEEFYYHVDDAFKVGNPFIYILDSMDAVDSEADERKFQSRKKAYREDEKATGTYGTAKAKTNSENIRRVVGKLQRTGSILIIISQTRDNLGFGFSKKSRAGGRSLRFYATLELWSSVLRKVSRTYKGKRYGIGTVCKVEVMKNRVNGQDHTVEIPIYHKHGIDDLGSCIDFLVGHKHWKKQKGGGLIQATELDLTLSRERLVAAIQQDSRLRVALRRAVGAVWKDIDSALYLNRVCRYRKGAGE